LAIGLFLTNRKDAKDTKEERRREEKRREEKEFRICAKIAM